MVIDLRLKDYLAIVRHAREKLPNEACGLLAGTRTDEKKRVEKVFFLTNTDASPEHFSMDPKEQFAAVKEMRAAGLTLLGNWHSHPATPSRPSEEDKRLAYDTAASYLILSLAGGEPVLNAFHVSREKAVTKEDLRIFEF